MMQLKTAALGAVVLALAAGPALAQGDAMAKAPMAKAPMASDHMSNDHMAKGGMADAKKGCKPMAKGPMAKDGTTGCEAAKAKTDSMSGGAMKSDGMMKDDGKAAKH